MENAKRAPLGLVFLIVFLDIVGFSILFPLFPALLDHYIGLEGDHSVVGHVVAWLRELAGADEQAVETLFGGILGSLYSILQFVMAPVWGGLSDRIGRRPTLVWTLLGTVASYVLWVFAGSFALLVAARILGGAMAGNISTASAVVGDTTSGEKRASGMGIIGMAIGLGFIAGPALGGIFGPRELGEPTTWTHGFALNPFSRCAMVAAALALANLFLVATRLRETLPPRERGESTRAHVLNPFSQLARLRMPGVARTSTIYFLFLTAFSAMEFSLTFLAVERFAFSIRDNTWMFVFVGLVIALIQGGVVRRLVPRTGERKLTTVGLALLLPSFALVAWCHAVWVLYVGLFGMAVGSALAMPCLSALVSRYAPGDVQGLALGTFRSLGSLSRAVGPILGGVLYWRLGSAAPYLAGAIWLVVPLGLTLRLPAPPSDAQVAGSGVR